MAETIDETRRQLRQDHGDDRVRLRTDAASFGDARPATAAPGASPMPAAPESIVARAGRRLRGTLRRAADRVIAASSLVPNDPVLDVRAFPWTQDLRDQWRAIRDEAIAAALPGHASPSLAAISPAHRRIAAPGMWRSFFLWGRRARIDANIARCPVTSTLLDRVPGLDSAFFSILTPGAHIPVHRGLTKGLITCHLALIVPHDGDARMRIGNRVVRWAEGETLVFDDTYAHEVWNETTGTRVVLLLQFARPLRNPGRWIAGRLVTAVRQSASARHVRDNILAWHAAMLARERRTGGRAG